MLEGCNEVTVTHSLVVLLGPAHHAAEGSPFAEPALRYLLRRLVAGNEDAVLLCSIRKEHLVVSTLAVYVDSADHVPAARTQAVDDLLEIGRASCRERV